MGKYKDMPWWLKWTTMFGRSHDHTASEIVRFVGVSKQTVQCVCKEWCTTGGQNIRCQKCGWENILTKEDVTHCQWKSVLNLTKIEGPPQSVSCEHSKMIST